MGYHWKNQMIKKIIKMVDDIMCFLDRHKWQELTPTTMTKYHPIFPTEYSVRNRVCYKCGLRQQYIPDYLDDRTGKWVNINKL